MARYALVAYLLVCVERNKFTVLSIILTKQVFNMSTQENIWVCASFYKSMISRICDIIDFVG